MIKQRLFLIVLLIFSYPIHNVANAQSYSIESFSGNNVKVDVSYKLFSKKLIISCSSDTLFLNDYTGTVGVHILNKKFLEIVYGVVGGTGLDLKNTLILAVDKNKINVAMLITSYSGAVSLDKEVLYKLKLNMTGNDKSNYKIIADIHDELKSKSKPEANYTHNKQVTLGFDASQHIFYSTQEKMSKYFTIFDHKNQDGKKQFIEGTFPVIKLGEYKNYFIKGEWYEKSDNANNYLVKYSFKNID